MSYLYECLRSMKDCGASDLYLVAGDAPILRVNGLLQRLTEEYILPHEFVEGVAQEI